jgi:putative phosphoesterase
MARIAVISDTHGLLREEALPLLEGSEAIIHAGDIGRPEILEALSGFAPVHAVRGNNDRGPWAEALPEARSLQVEDVLVHVLHDIGDLTLERVWPAPRVIVTGHSHRPSIREKDGVLYLNPGSAGPRRFKLPVTMAELLISGGAAHGRILEIELPRPR